MRTEWHIAIVEERATGSALKQSARVLRDQRFRTSVQYGARKPVHSRYDCQALDAHTSDANRQDFVVICSECALGFLGDALQPS